MVLYLLVILPLLGFVALPYALGNGGGGSDGSDGYGSNLIQSLPNLATIFNHVLALFLVFSFASSGMADLAKSGDGLLGYDGLSLSLVWLMTLLAPFILLNLGRHKLMNMAIFWIHLYR
jgi:hypothetical protein